MPARTVPVAACCLCVWLAGAICAGEESSGRLLVRIPPVELAGRRHDERPVEFRLTANDLPAGRRLDPATLEVHLWDPVTGTQQGKPFSFRWYDDAVPYDFPDCEQSLHATDGVHLKYTIRPRWGDYYNLQGDGAGGRLVWLHRQRGDHTATYEIRFQMRGPGHAPGPVAPRGFVGDGSHRCASRGHTSTSFIHSRVTVADWTGDGLTDLLIGSARGNVLLYQNLGSRTEPRYGAARLLLTTENVPLDSGWSAAPCAVDWNGDGLTDLLVGADRNRAVYYRNTGNAGAPRLELAGFVRVGDQPLELPITPVPKSPEGVYTLDYYPVLEAVDWNGDGRRDLLAGGYVTGRVFLYENIGTWPDGTPRLEARGPLEADGVPLNVGDWAAAPTTADFDGDGDLDLICGNMPLTEGGGDHVDARTFLRYYENVGSRREPRLEQRSFPRRGEFPHGSLATPRAGDLNGDGLFDLAVSAGEQVYLFLNVGTAQRPEFAVDSPPLASEWGSAPLPTWGVQFLDWNNDGRLDLLSGLEMFINQGDDSYARQPLLPAGDTIEHPAPRGDAWTFTQLADLTGDGQLDLLFGTHEGQIWLHAHHPGDRAGFDVRGKLLRQGDEELPIRVGPLPDQQVDFDVLQGARTTLSTADFNADGLTDLVVGDTYGKVRLFRNTGTRTTPRFAAPLELGDMKIRMIPYAADWDGDGHPDIVGSSADGKVWWWRNTGSGAFDAEQPIRMPEVCYSPFAAVVDWNGDGDLDLFVGTAYGYNCWFDRSFLERGYGRAERIPEQSKR